MNEKAGCGGGAPLFPAPLGGPVGWRGEVPVRGPLLALGRGLELESQGPLTRPSALGSLLPRPELRGFLQLLNTPGRGRCFEGKRTDGKEGVVQERGQVSQLSEPASRPSRDARDGPWEPCAWESPGPRGGLDHRCSRGPGTWVCVPGQELDLSTTQSRLGFRPVVGQAPQRDASRPRGVSGPLSDRRALPGEQVRVSRQRAVWYPLHLGSVR